MTESIDAALERIRTDLSKLRTADFRRAVFGARSHHYTVHATLAAADVDAFEREHGVALPEDYRRFVTAFGDGGAGPAYGVHRLAMAVANPWLELGRLAEPFEVDADHQGANYQGCLMISQRGCGGWTFLVVAGPLRGQIWYDDTVADMGLRRAADSFTAWYQGWLTSSLDAAANKPRDETAELVDRLDAIADKAPETLASIVDSEPDQERLLAPLMTVALNKVQGNRPAAALVLYEQLFRLPVPADGKQRTAYLEALNNGIIAGCLAGEFARAVAISDTAQPYVAENPFITHSAACAYMGAGDPDKALEQCRLAVRHRYPHLDLLAADQDLAPLSGHPDFKQLFGR